VILLTIVLVGLIVGYGIWIDGIGGGEKKEYKSLYESVEVPKELTIMGVCDARNN
jgi:hypothetical protein